MAAHKSWARQSAWKHWKMCLPRWAAVGREGRLRVVRLAVERAGAAALPTATAQGVEQSQVLQNLLHRDLRARA